MFLWKFVGFLEELGLKQYWEIAAANKEGGCPLEAKMGKQKTGDVREWPALQVGSKRLLSRPRDLLHTCCNNCWP